MTKKIALITGITGQDGSYLAEFLLKKGYKVIGVQRRASTFNTSRIDHIYDKEEYPDFVTIYGDMSDSGSINRILEKAEPDEVYNLAAQSHVRVSFDVPEYTADVVGIGPLRILDSIKEMGLKTKFYQASSSEMFGLVQEIPQNEKTPFYPRSPYAAAKVFAFWMTKMYREGYGLFACNGILFNHESPRRGETFVTRKITRGLVRIKLGMDEKLSLGNLEAKRDWGYAKDYVEGMYLMLQQSNPDDYVLATNETHTVREFAEEACRVLDIDIVWKGSGINETGVDSKTGKLLIEINPIYFRPTEVDILIGDYAKAKDVLGWKPQTKFKDLVRIMVDYDMEQQKANVINGKTEVKKA